jgi:hypothetical protein
MTHTMERPQQGRIARKIANLERLRAHHGANRPRRAALGPDTVIIQPSGDGTGLGDYDAIMGAGGSVYCAPGSWYLSGQVVVGPELKQVGGTADTVFQPGSKMSSGTGLFTFGSGGRLTGIGAALSGNPLVDFGNTWVTDIEVDHITAAQGSGPVVTGADFHRSHVHDLWIEQNDPATPWFEMGAGTGVSTSTFEDIVTVAGCDANGNRSAGVFQLIAPGQENLDDLVFQNCFTLNGANAAGVVDNSQYGWDIASSGGAGIFGDRLRVLRCDFGSWLGGVLRVRGFSDVELDVSVGNIYPQNGREVTHSLVSVGAWGSNGYPTNACSIKYFREGAGPQAAEASPYDIQVWPNCDQVTLEMLRASGGLPVQVNVGQSTNVVGLNTGAASITSQAPDTTLVGGQYGVQLGGSPLVPPANFGRG